MTSTRGTFGEGSLRDTDPQRHQIRCGRVALLIGNRDYSGQTMRKLFNPIHDVEAISKTLSTLKFDVSVKQNLAENDFRGALEEFAERSARSEVSLIYFAGHGFQISHKNYLIPVDFAAVSQSQAAAFETLCQRRCVTLDDITACSKANYSLVFIDACRDDAARRAEHNAPSEIEVITRSGFAKVSDRGLPPRTLLAFSAEAGQSALDGQGRHSPYAQAFMRHIVSDSSLQNIMSEVRGEVYRETNGKQRPFEINSFEGVFSLFARPEAPQVSAQQTPTPLSKEVLASLSVLAKRSTTTDGKTKEIKPEQIPNFRRTKPTANEDYKPSIAAFSSKSASLADESEAKPHAEQSESKPKSSEATVLQKPGVAEEVATKETNAKLSGRKDESTSVIDVSAKDEETTKTTSRYQLFILCLVVAFFSAIATLIYQTFGGLAFAVLAMLGGLCGLYSAVRGEVLFGLGIIAAAATAVLYDGFHWSKLDPLGLEAQYLLAAGVFYVFALLSYSRLPSVRSAFGRFLHYFNIVFGLSSLAWIIYSYAGVGVLSMISVLAGAFALGILF